MTELVGELATRSDAFRTQWAAHHVRLHRTGAKQFRHPLVGELSVGFDAMELPADQGLTLTAYTAEPGSASADKLALLARWSAPLPHQEPPPQPRGRASSTEGRHSAVPSLSTWVEAPAP